MGRFSDYQTSHHLRGGAHEGNIRAFSGLKKDAKYRRSVIAEGPYEGIPAFADYRSHFMEFFNDFLKYPDYDVTNEWTLTQENSNASGAVTLSDDAAYGYLNMAVTDTTDDYGLSLQFTAANGAGEFVKLAADKICIFETRLFIADATQSDFFAGLAITDTDLAAAGGAFIDTTDYVGFEKDDGDAYLDFVSAKNSTEDKNAAIATMSNSTWTTLAFRADGISSITPWVKNSSGLWVRKEPVSAAANICDDEELCITFGICNGEGAAKTLRADYVRILLER